MANSAGEGALEPQQPRRSRHRPRVQRERRLNLQRVRQVRIEIIVHVQDLCTDTCTHAEDRQRAVYEERHGVDELLGHRHDDVVVYDARDRLVHVRPVRAVVDVVRVVVAT